MIDPHLVLSITFWFASTPAVRFLGLESGRPV